MSDTATDHAGTARRHLGELGAMANQCEHAERDILQRAEKQLTDVNAKIDGARGKSLASDEGADAYSDLIAERGRLNLVIAHSRAILSPA